MQVGASCADQRGLGEGSGQGWRARCHHGKEAVLSLRLGAEQAHVPHDALCRGSVEAHGKGSAMPFAGAALRPEGARPVDLPTYKDMVQWIG